MLSKQQLAFIRSLHQKKFRQMYGKFLVEGDKLVRELLHSGFKIDAIYSVNDWQMTSHTPDESPDNQLKHVFISENELKKISTHETPNQVLAVVDIPKPKPGAIYTKLNTGLYLACDELNDPGNAGTIIRTAEWFGVDAIFFSENSVDIYNPKVVNAAKGSLFRIPCYYEDLGNIFEANRHLSVYGTFMDGENIYESNLDKNAFVLIGNEANGISHELTPFIHHRISVPAFGKAESLNAGVATGVVLSEFRRR